MPIQTTCPSCSQQVRVPDQLLGRNVKCPACSHVFLATDASGGVPPTRPERVPPPSSYEDQAPADDYEDSAPEQDDYGDERPRRRRRRRRSGGGAAGRVMAPAICMLIVAALGFLINSLSLVTALALPPEKVEAGDPPFVQEFKKNSRGPLAAGVQGLCVLMSLVTVFGSIQMMRTQTYGLAMTATILSMLNFGNCCCLFGLPFGIWGIAVLMNGDVKEAFT
jgi:predicted Zn finger-like uncharacterized protein